MTRVPLAPCLGCGSYDGHFDGCRGVLGNRTPQPATLPARAVGRGDRPCVSCDGYDRTRGNVALAKLGLALGVKPDASQPDHVLLEQLADAARVLRRAYDDKGDWL